MTTQRLYDHHGLCHRVISTRPDGYPVLACGRDYSAGGRDWCINSASGWCRWRNHRVMIRCAECWT